jgi:hypothetical protein
MGIEPTRTVLPVVKNKRFGAMANLKCDWRVNFRGMWGNVGIHRREIPGSSQPLSTWTSRPSASAFRTLYSLTCASPAPSSVGSSLSLSSTTRIQSRVVPEIRLRRLLIPFQPMNFGAHIANHHFQLRRFCL